MSAAVIAAIVIASIDLALAAMILQSKRYSRKAQKHIGFANAFLNALELTDNLTDQKWLYHLATTNNDFAKRYLRLSDKWIGPGLITGRKAWRTTISESTDSTMNTK